MDNTLCKPDNSFSSENQVTFDSGSVSHEHGAVFSSQFEFDTTLFELLPKATSAEHHGCCSI